MGIDFTALFSHNLSWEELYILPVHINNAWSDIEYLLPVLEGLPDSSIEQPDKWQWKRDRRYSSISEELFNEGFALLHGPNGFLGTIGKKVIEIDHIARWWLFLTEPTVTEKLQKICRLLAGVFRTDCAIYLPDSSYNISAVTDLLYEGKDIDEVQKWLIRDYGFPADKIKNIFTEDENSWNGEGYYIDNFF